MDLETITRLATSVNERINEWMKGCFTSLSAHC